MTAQEDDPSNWVDPDIIAYFESTGGSIPSFDPVGESEFKNFFVNEWQSSEFDDIRERWDPLINDPDPHSRVLGKTALWNLVRLRRLRQSMEQ